MKPLKKVGNIFDRSCDILAILAAILLYAILLLVCSEVLMRSSMRHSIIWVIEICEYSLLFITFLATTWLLRRNGHVTIDLVVSRLKPRPQTMVKIITSIACAIVSLVLTWYGVRVTILHFQHGYLISSVLMPPSYIIQSIIPVGSFLLSIQFIRMTYGYLKRWKAPPELE